MRELEDGDIVNIDVSPIFDGVPRSLGAQRPRRTDRGISALVDRLPRGPERDVLRWAGRDATEEGPDQGVA